MTETASNQHLIDDGGRLLRQWAQYYRGGTQIGYPSVNMIKRIEARMAGEDGDLRAPPEDELAEQVERALLAMREVMPGPYAVLRGFYLPRDAVPMEAVARTLKVGRKKAAEWHLMGLCWVIARVDT
jgi:hypothetical protein